MSDIIVSHIKELLFAKRWSEEQIAEIPILTSEGIWEGLLCVNKKPLALLKAFKELLPKEIRISEYSNDLISQSVQVGFIYFHPNKIFLISLLSSKKAIQQIDDFLTPEELLAYIYGQKSQSSHYFILLPKLISGTLKFFIAFLDGLFTLFNSNERKLRYYYPNDYDDDRIDNRQLYNYLKDHYPEERIGEIPSCADDSTPFAVLVPYEVQQGLYDSKYIPNEASSVGEYFEIDSSSNNAKRGIRLSNESIKEKSSVIEHFQHLFDFQKNHLSKDISYTLSRDVDNSIIENHIIESNESSPLLSDNSRFDIVLEIPDKRDKSIAKKNKEYNNFTINNTNMARQTSYQTQIELASELKRYLHGFQERLAEVAKNYQSKSHDLYEAGMMDETHRDFEDNYVNETVSHIAEVVELINERDIPFVQKYIEKMEELREQYGK